MSDEVKALIAEARRLIADCATYNFGMRNADKLAHEVAGKLADALGAAQQAPAVDREALARVIHEVDYYGLNVGGKVTVRSYATADAVIASGVLQDAAEVEARGLEKAAQDFLATHAQSGHSEFFMYLRARAQQVREGKS